MTIVLRWNSPWLRVLVYLVSLAAWVVASAREIRFVYQGF